MQGSEKLPRRSLLSLVTAGVASAVAGLHISPVRAGKDDDGGTVAPELEGTWFVTVTRSDGQTFPATAAFARGGVLSVSDAGAPPESGNMYLGTWVKTGHHEYAFAFLGFQFEAKSLSSYIRVHESIKLERDGKTYNGVTTIEILDLDMKVFVTVGATTRATRINAL